MGGTRPEVLVFRLAVLLCTPLSLFPLSFYFTTIAFLRLCPIGFLAVIVSHLISSVILLGWCGLSSSRRRLVGRSAMRLSFTSIFSSVFLSLSHLSHLSHCFWGLLFICPDGSGRSSNHHMLLFVRYIADCGLL